MVGRSTLVLGHTSARHSAETPSRKCPDRPPWLLNRTRPKLLKGAIHTYKFIHAHMHTKQALWGEGRPGRSDPVPAMSNPSLAAVDGGVDPSQLLFATLTDPAANCDLVERMLSAKGAELGAMRTSGAGDR